MMNCDTHDCPLDCRDVGRGKTLWVCPDCEREQQQRLETIFGPAPLGKTQLGISDSLSSPLPLNDVTREEGA